MLNNRSEELQRRWAKIDEIEFVFEADAGDSH